MFIVELSFQDFEGQGIRCSSCCLTEEVMLAVPGAEPGNEACAVQGAGAGAGSVLRKSKQLMPSGHACLPH